MKIHTQSFAWNDWTLMLAAVMAVGVSGCSLLKPANANPRYFVLTTLPAPDPAPRGGMGLAIGQVRIPSYLTHASIAVRRGTNEIEYPTMIEWAERLDQGLQRALAANLTVLLPTDRVRLSNWRGEEVKAEVFVTIQQFDVDSSGHAMLIAYWRVLSPGGEKILRSGKTQLAKSGPSPDSDPSGAVRSLSGLVEDFSRELAQTLKDSASP